MTQRHLAESALASGNPTLLTDEATGELEFRTGIQILELHAQAHTGRAVVRGHAQPRDRPRGRPRDRRRGSASDDIQRVMGAQTVGAGQMSLRLASTLVAGSRYVDVALGTIGDDRPLWHPTFDAGTLPSRTPGLAIARRASDDLHVALGDRLTVMHPVSTAPTHVCGSSAPRCWSPASTPALRV
jgi:hypothetical protein